MTTKHNRSRFEVRPSHLVAPHIWIEHPPPRASSSSSSSSSSPSQHHSHTFKHHYFTKVSTSNHTFYEDYHTYKINHFTLDDDHSITTPSQFTPAKSNYSLHIDLANISPNLASHSPYHANKQDHHANQDHPNPTPIDNPRGSTTSLSGCGTLVCTNDGSLHMDIVDVASHLTHEIHNHSCSIKDLLKEEEGDTFTFSSSLRHAFDAGDLINVMSPADELFEDGKIRPLAPVVINAVECDRLKSSNNCMINHVELPSKGCIEGLIVGNYEVDLGLITRDGVNSVETNQGLNRKSIHGDHQMMVEVAHDSLAFKFKSLSAPATPVREDVAIDGAYDHNEEQGIKSEISTSSQFKRCRSLTRFPMAEKNEIKTLKVQDYTLEEAYGGNRNRKGINREGGCIMSKRRTTLEDFLKQEGDHLLKPKEEQSSPKTSPKNVPYSSKALKRPSRTPTPINLPQQRWPSREPLSVTSKNKVRAVSPHVVHYTFHKTQAQRMKKRTFLPYRPRLLGCLGPPLH